MLRLPAYVLITPARNEADFIELTISSMVRQTVKPLKWVIVSDGSTDGTDEIVAKYVAEYSWIELVRMPERSERHFAGKVNAFNAGYDRVASLPYDLIGNLDADISFDDDYCFHLLSKFSQDPKLGVAGTLYRELNGKSSYEFVNVEHVPGACQLFRRKCFEEIGGYAPVKGGAVDSIAVMSARMKGWQTRRFADNIYVHHRESGTAQVGVLTSRFRKGGKAYAVGNHPIWELLRSCYQMTKKPLVIGGLALLAGYMWSSVRQPQRPVSPELVAFHRREQMQLLRQLLTGGRPFRRKTV